MKKHLDPKSLKLLMESKSDNPEIPRPIKGISNKNLWSLELIIEYKQLVTRGKDYR